MIDIISGIGVIAGVSFIIIGLKKQSFKSLKIAGILLIIIAIGINASDFIKGFKDGFMNGSKP